MTYIEQAVKTLKEGYTCVVVGETGILTSSERGVKPLVVWYEEGRDFRTCAVADKVVGRGAAFLYLLLGVKRLHACVISEPALALLREAGCDASYDTCVPHIINRAGDGICPFEDAVMHMHDPLQAYNAILKKMNEMNITR